MCAHQNLNHISKWQTLGKKITKCPQLFEQEGFLKEIEEIIEDKPGEGGKNLIISIGQSSEQKTQHLDFASDSFMK